MVRSISPQGMATLAQRQGTEPITIIEVDWGQDGAPSMYADRDINNIPGRIIEVGDLDNVINVSDNSSSQELSVTLDDTDGTIKAIFDSRDIHKRTARIYQYFEGLALSDRFLLFAGKISSPVTWNERDRTVKFTLVSQLEDREIGFSAEEGQFPFLPADMVGKAWPLIFGTVKDCPALQVNQAVQGTTLTGVGIISGLNEMLAQPIYEDGLNIDANVFVTVAQLNAQISTLWCGHSCWRSVDAARAKEILDQINDLEKQKNDALRQAYLQQACAVSTRNSQVEDAEKNGLGANPIKVLGGEDFPQNTPICVEINGGLFWGHFEGQDFYVSRRQQPDDEETVHEVLADRTDSCSFEDGTYVPYEYRIDVPCGCASANIFNDCECVTKGFVASTSKSSGSSSSSDAIAQQFWVEPGATVRMHSDEPITYIVSIVPGTVLAVRAYKQFTGERRLVNVPTNLYRVVTVDYGPVTAVQLVFNRPLSAIKDQGWSDDVYVTFQSAVGPNLVDILVHLIDRYTDLSWDAATFDYVRTRMERFPANFPILDRKNALDVLQDIAFQARCGLWINNGVFYLKYLPEEPSPVDTITVGDLDAEKGVEVELTSTETLVTKMKITWRLSWADGETDRDKDRGEKKIILRHNVTRYGIQEEDYDWYIYNQPDIIYKCATFWLIRKSNTWKKIKFTAFLNKLHLETFDCVLLDFAGKYVANGPVKAIVEKANYNSADNCVDFECLVPVRAGEMEQSPFFWPANLSPDETWPPQAAIASGDAGGGGIGAEATGTLPVGYVGSVKEGGVVWVGGPNVVFGPHSDYGDSTPTDREFVAQTIHNPQILAELTHTPKPHVNLRTYTLRPSKPKPVPQIKGGISIDLHKTRVVDSKNPSARSATLSSVIYGISQDGELLMDTKAKFANDEHREGAEFDFRYDGEGKKFAAGTAYLKDA
jgi:hypothetical protein